MREYSGNGWKLVKDQCDGCGGTPHGWKTDWLVCPVHGDTLKSEAEIDAEQARADADYMRDNPDYGIDMVQYAHDLCGMRRVG